MTSKNYKYLNLHCPYYLNLFDLEIIWKWLVTKNVILNSHAQYITRENTTPHGFPIPTHTVVKSHLAMLKKNQHAAIQPPIIE